MTIGEKIRVYRTTIAGLTQKELAEKAGCAEITIRQYETGKRQPRLEQLQKIADAIGLPLGQFIDFEEFSSMKRNENLEEWFNEEKNIENSLPPGYSLGGDYAEGELWLIYPDRSTVSVSLEELEDIIADCGSYMEYKLQSLKKKQ